MKLRHFITFIGIWILATSTLHAEKKREWQTGKVLDSERSSYLAGTVGKAARSQRAVYAVYETFMIETDSFVYVAEERIKWRWSKLAILTVGAPVKFAIEKRKLFVMDEEGKEHVMEITKRILRK